MEKSVRLILIILIVAMILVVVAGGVLYFTTAKEYCQVYFYLIRHLMTAIIWNGGDSFRQPEGQNRFLYRDELVSAAQEDNQHPLLY